MLSFFSRDVLDGIWDLIGSVSQAEFYGDLVSKFRKIVGKAEFSDQFKIFIMRYKHIGYIVDVMRQSACLLVNLIMINNFAVLYMPMGRGSDSMKAQHEAKYVVGWGWNLSVSWPIGFQLVVFFRFRVSVV